MGIVRGSGAEVKWVEQRKEGDLTQSSLRRRAEFAEKSVDEVTKPKILLRERVRVYLFPERSVSLGHC